MAAKRKRKPPRPTSTARQPARARRARFAQEYLIDLNATQAAIRAGYSQKTAYSQGQRLLKNDEVAGLIATSQAERAKRVQMTADEVLERLAMLARLNLADYVEYDEPGTPTNGVRVKGSDTLTREQLYGVAEVTDVVSSLGDKVGVKLKLRDPMAAINLLFKHLGMVAPTRHQVGGDPNGEPVKTEGGLSRATIDELKRDILGIGGSE